MEKPEQENLGDCQRVRAKFTCNWKQTRADGVGEQISFCPVYSGSEENKRFFQSTPGGEVRLFTTNPSAAAFFEQGKEYYLDFTPA